MKMLKDVLVAVFVIGTFVTGAVGLAAETRKPWPQTELQSTSVVCAQATDEGQANDHLVAVTYVISGDCVKQ
ncbi:MAG TPA: hypothetical protein VKN99_11795 [Polyangia bacterium]|nr:hypothetical protein [Polyangia bacterium]